VCGDHKLSVAQICEALDFSRATLDQHLAVADDWRSPTSPMVSINMRFRDFSEMPEWLEHYRDLEEW
jgi:hypothetical protein